MSTARPLTSRSSARSTWIVALGGVLGAALGVLALLWWLEVGAQTTLAPVALPAVAETAEATASAGASPLAQSSDGSKDGSSPDAGSLPARASAARPTVARAPGVQRQPLLELTQPHEWPAEPETPATVDDALFLSALDLLCGPYADRTVSSWYGPWLLRAAREHGSDPFLLGGLMFFMSGCAGEGSRFGKGLTGLDGALYRSDLTRGRYRYRAFEAGGWVEHSSKLKRFPFNDEFVASPESNLYFAAAFLPAWSQQASGLRAAFVQPAEYRHYVSHFVWGDLVRSHREEDAILVERRRLLEYYGAKRPVAPVRWHGFELGCPLDGCPRLVTSTLGDAREAGARLHAGNDFESTRGEPVRAIADGTVVFAGVDLPARAPPPRSRSGLSAT